MQRQKKKPQSPTLEAILGGLILRMFLSLFSISVKQERESLQLTKY